MSEQINRFYEFGPFRLVPWERQLLRDDKPVTLPPKAMDTLLVLVQNSGHAVKKDDLMRTVWPEAFVEESNLNHYVSLLRKTLGDGNSGERYIETVPKHGYRFVAEVRVKFAEAGTLLLHKHTRTHVLVREETQEQTTGKDFDSPVSASRRRLGVPAFVIVIAAVGSLAAYFGYIKPIHSRSVTAASAEAASSRRSGTENPAAREAYLKGRFFWNKRTPDDIWKAETEFENALRIDPNYAPAYAGLADCYLLGGAVPGITGSAKTLALKALSIDDNLAEAHASLAYYKGAVEWDWSGAESEFQRAIFLDPQYATARHWHAYNLGSMGRLDEALSEIEKARELDPLSAIITTDVGHILYLARRYDEAIAQYLKALEMNTEFRVAYWRLGEAYTQQHKYSEAAAQLQRAIDLDSAKNSEIEAWMGYQEAVANHTEKALKILDRLKTQAELHGRSYEIALIYSGLGDKDAAFVWLEKALKIHEGQLALIKVEPMLDNLRDDPRYLDLLRRINLLP